MIERQPPPRPAVVFVTQAPVVGKPFDIAVLRETVRRVLSRP